MIEQEIQVSLQYHMKMLQLIWSEMRSAGLVTTKPFMTTCGDKHGWGEHDLRIIYNKLAEDKLIEEEYAIAQIPTLTPLGYEVHYLLENNKLDKYRTIAINCGIPLNVTNLMFIKNEIIRKEVISLPK